MIMPAFDFMNVKYQEMLNSLLNIIPTKALSALAYIEK